MTATSTELDVYWISGSPYSWRVLLALELKRLPYRSHLLEASKQDHKNPEFLALNPRGHVPVLKNGATVVTESLAIMVYLDSLYPATPLFPAEPEEKARTWRQFSEFFSYLEAPINRIVRPIYFNQVAEQEASICTAAKTVHAELKRWEQEVGDARWLGGDNVSATDVALYPFFKSLLRAAAKPTAEPLELGFLPLSRHYPQLSTWMDRIEGLAGYQRTYPPHWRA